MTEKTTIYVIAHNGGYEGHSLPYLAFWDKAKALQWCQGQSEIFDVVEVPIFPELPTRCYFNIEPERGPSL